MSFDNNKVEKLYLRKIENIEISNSKNMYIR